MYRLPEAIVYDNPAEVRVVAAGVQGVLTRRGPEISDYMEVIRMNRRRAAAGMEPKAVPERDGTLVAAFRLGQRISTVGSGDPFSIELPEAPIVVSALTELLTDKLAGRNDSRGPLPARPTPFSTMDPLGRQLGVYDEETDRIAWIAAQTAVLAKQP